MSSYVPVTGLEHGGWKVLVVAILLIVMQFMMVMGRFISRRMQKVSLAVDDYILLVATVITMGLCGLAIAFPRIAGVGSHIANIQSTTPSEGTLIGQSFMAWMIIFGLSIAASKCAILLLYVRVFTTCKRAFTIIAYLVGFIIIATAISNTFIAAFQCNPQNFAWDKSIAGGTCVDEIAWARYMAIPNVVTGAVMLVMPLPIVWRLNVSISAKIALTATFLHGIIGFVASCARLSILFSTDVTHFSNNTSLTWTIWTINEPANYIIAACLPTLRPIYLRILPPSFFILSKPSSSKPLNSSIKVSWPSGSLVPRFSLGERRFMTNSHITGPWYIEDGMETRRFEADGEEGWLDLEDARTDVNKTKSAAVVGTQEVSPTRDL